MGLGAVMVVSVLLFAGCGGDDDDSAGTDPTAEEAGSASGDGATSGGSGSDSPDACTLLSEEEAGEVLGGPIVEVGPSTGPGESVCSWEIEGEWSVTVSVGTPGTAPGDSFDPSMVLMLGTEEPVAGVDGAYFVGQGTVAFAADERVNTVQVALIDQDEARAGAEQLAGPLAPRIG